jgi:arsenate reductase-like glutaredoxin family protein
MGKLFFSMSELIHSDTAIKYRINNMPDITSMDNMLNLIHYLLNPLRTYLKRPIIVSSGFRCKELNAKVGGSENSQHLKGQAVDILAEGMKAKDLAKFILNTGLDFDQLILEKKGLIEWVHISFVKKNNRNQYLEIKE